MLDWKTAALLRGNRMASRVGERRATAALLGGRELDDDSCPACWGDDGLILGGRELDEGCPAGLEDGCAAWRERVGRRLGY